MKDTPMTIDGGERTLSAAKAGKKKMTASPSASKHDLPWVEKYRPSSLKEVVAQDDIVNILTRLLDSNRLPHLLFYGPPGSGKTSTILACAKKMYGASNWRSMVLELNASDDRGIDVVRNEIKEFAGTKRLFSSGVKLIVLDEADSMTNDAQFALRRVIEKYSKFTRFCIICNYVNKIIPALQSRCTKFRFAPLHADNVKPRLQEIIRAESLNVTDDGIQSLLHLGKGDMRRILNLLQCTSMAYPVVNEENTYLTSGNPLPKDVEQVMDQLMNGSYDEAMKYMCRLKGYALSDLLTDIAAYVHRVDLPDVVMQKLMARLADIEYRLMFCTSDKLQLASVIGAFAEVRTSLKC